MDDPSRGRHEPIAAAQGEESETDAQRQDHVRAFAPHQIGHLVKRAAVQRVRAWQQSVCLKIGVHRNARSLREGAQLSGATRLPGAHAGHDDRALRLAQQFERLSDPLAGGRGWRFYVDGVRDRYAANLDRGTQNVGRQVQQNGTRRAGGRDADCMGDEPWKLLNSGDLMRPFRDWPRNRDLVDSRLQRVGFGVAQRGRAAQVKDRGAVKIGVRHRSDDVREARARGYHCDAERSGRPRVAFGGMSGGHLVARVEDLDVVIPTRLENGLQMRTVQAEDALDTGFRERLNHEFAAGNRASHARPLE